MIAFLLISTMSIAQTFESENTQICVDLSDSTVTVHLDNEGANRYNILSVRENNKSTVLLCDQNVKVKINGNTAKIYFQLKGKQTKAAGDRVAVAPIKNNGLIVEQRI